MAYAWLSQRPGVDSILLGPASVAQLDAGLQGCSTALPRELAARIDSIHFDHLGTEVSYAR